MNVEDDRLILIPMFELLKPILEFSIHFDGGCIKFTEVTKPFEKYCFRIKPNQELGKIAICSEYNTCNGLNYNFK